MEYTLTEAEQTTVKKLRSQLADTQNIIEQARKILSEHQAKVTAINGALQGVVMLMADQQGLLESDKDTVSLNEEGDRLTVTRAQAEPEA